MHTDSSPSVVSQTERPKRERRIHPMSYGHSEAYSKDEFVAYALEQNLGPDAGLQMWNEAVPLEQNVPNYGNWGGIAVSLPKFRVYHPERSNYYEMPKVLCKSRSCGELTEGGRATGRHPNGHPTASGLGWIVAT